MSSSQHFQTLLPPRARATIIRHPTPPRHHLTYTFSQNLARHLSGLQNLTATTCSTPLYPEDFQTGLSGFNDPRPISNTDPVYLHAPVPSVYCTFRDPSPIPAGKRKSQMRYGVGASKECLKLNLVDARGLCKSIHRTLRTSTHLKEQGKCK